jgi:hypothetical protein
MDITGLTKAEFKAWVDFDEEVSVLVRYVPRDQLAEIGKDAVVVTVGPGKKEERSYDALAADIAIAKAAVIDWRGLEVDGEPFPFTPENLELLILKWGAFSKFISNACVDVSGLALAQKENGAKNS